MTLKQRCGGRAFYQPGARCHFRRFASITSPPPRKRLRRHAEPTCINRSFAAGHEVGYFIQRLTQHRESPNQEHHHADRTCPDVCRRIRLPRPDPALGDQPVLAISQHDRRITLTIVRLTEGETPCPCSPCSLKALCISPASFPQHRPSGNKWIQQIHGRWPMANANEESPDVSGLSPFATRHRALCATRQSMRASCATRVSRRRTPRIPHRPGLA